jgi:uncharacterized repeat protein (TIGR01451 family)
LKRSWIAGIRVVCLALFIAVAGQTLQPAHTFAAGEAITLTPNSGAVGSSFTVTGGGFVTSPVGIYFNGTFLGSANVVGGNLVNATFQVPNVPANHTYSVAVASGAFNFSQSANFTVLASGSTLGNLGLSKFIQTSSGFTACPNGGGCTIQNSSGASETYAIQYQNTANAPIAQLTISDTLQAGQTFVSASAGCVASTTSPVTVTCTVANVPASPLNGSINSVTITTRPTTGFAGVITNQACATELGFVGQACSNTTYLTIGGTSVATGTQICGVVTFYMPPSPFANAYGLVTIGGQTFTIAPTAQISSTITTTSPNNNVCIRFTFVNQAATVLTVTPNLATANVICGVLTVVSPSTASMVVGGIAYPTLSSVMTTTALVLGQTYCFLLQNGTIVGVLTGTPTEAHAASNGGYHVNRMIAE